MGWMTVCLETVVGLNSSRVGTGPSRYCTLALPVVKSAVTRDKIKFHVLGCLPKEMRRMGSVANEIERLQWAGGGRWNPSCHFYNGA